MGEDDPLEKELATHSSILAWEIPWTEGDWWATVCGVSKSLTRLSNYEKLAPITCYLFAFKIVNMPEQSVVSNSLRPHGLYHTRLLCP